MENNTNKLLASVAILLSLLLVVGIIIAVNVTRQPTVEELRLQLQRTEQAKQDNQKAADEAAIEGDRRVRQYQTMLPEPRWVGKEDEATKEIARLKSRLASAEITQTEYEQDIQAEFLEKFPH